MYQLNESIMKSSLFENFLADKENEILFQTFLKEPNLSNKNSLDEAFKTHTRLVLAVTYIKKMIYYESRRFDKKTREFRRKEPLILNGTVEESLTLIDTISDENAENSFQSVLEVNIDEVLTDARLLDAMLKLTERQREILFYSYVSNWSDTMIAKKYNVSQQAITKSHNKALAKLREVMK